MLTLPCSITNPHSYRRENPGIVELKNPNTHGWVLCWELLPSGGCTGVREGTRVSWGYSPALGQKKSDLNTTSSPFKGRGLHNKKCTHTHTQKYLWVLHCPSPTQVRVQVALPSLASSSFLQIWPLALPCSSSCNLLGLQAPSHQGNTWALVFQREGDPYWKVERGQSSEAPTGFIQDTQRNWRRPDSSWKQGLTLWISPGTSSLENDAIALGSLSCFLIASP